MLDNIRSYSQQALVYCQHTTIGILAEGIPALISSIIAAAHKIAMRTLTLITSIALLYLHHNLFALGFVAGFVFDGTVKEIVAKVASVYSAKRSLLEQVCFFGGGSFLALYTMPTSLVIATLYYSAQWGASLCRYYKKSDQEPKDQKISDPQDHLPQLNTAQEAG